MKINLKKPNLFILLPVVLICVSSGCNKPTENNNRNSKENENTKPVQKLKNKKTNNESFVPGKSWFTNVTNESGVDFIYHSGAKGNLEMPEIMGSGIALFDYDNDGDLDLYFTNGNNALPDKNLQSSPVNKMYEQVGPWKFVDVTEKSGLGDGGYGNGVTTGDIDNDGDLDLYVTNYGVDSLYLNNGDKTYKNITSTSGINIDQWTASCCFIDYNMDGYLDLYVVNYVEYKPGLKCVMDTGLEDYCGPSKFKPTFDFLYKNNGDGTFTDVSKQAGLHSSQPAAGLGIVVEDFNSDGYPDLYVTNDEYSNFLWMNNQNGTFSERSLMKGVSFNINGQPEAGMGIVAADFNNDLLTDLFMTHLATETNTFYRNLGFNMGFSDATNLSGLGASSKPYTGFETASNDIDHDGDLDIMIVNGRIRRRELVAGAVPRPPFDKYAQHNQIYINQGNAKFVMMDQLVDEFSSPVEISRGLAIGDIDNDGDFDLVTSEIAGTSKLFRNDAPKNGNWLLVRAIDPAINRDAFGARIIVTAGVKQWARTLHPAGSYQSSNDSRVHFGIGNEKSIEKIEVVWPGGDKEKFAVDNINSFVTLEKGKGQPAL